MATCGGAAAGEACWHQCGPLTLRPQPKDFFRLSLSSPALSLLTSQDPWGGTWPPQNLLTCPHQCPQLRAVIELWLLDHLSELSMGMRGAMEGTGKSSKNRKDFEGRQVMFLTHPQTPRSQSTGNRVPNMVSAHLAMRINTPASQVMRERA